MSAVSNFLLRRNDGRDLEIRPVRRDEIEQAVRLILSGSVGPGLDDASVEFLQIAVFRGLDLTGIWVAVDPRDKMQWAVLPMTLAGRAMLLMVPPRLRPNIQPRHVAELIASSLTEARRSGVTLAQVLLDPSHRAVHRALVESGFEDVAELIYLSRNVHSPIAGKLIADEFRVWRYDRATHYRFARCIERTYVDSLDCPQLNGRRDMEDIIAGHKAAGEFDPELWMLVSDIADNDLGVMLLNRLHRRDGYELVYIGLTPEARGQGLADSLMRLAINGLANEGGGHIVTACDGANAPARKLYHRHGFGYLYSRQALIKELSPGPKRAPRELPPA